MEVWSLATPSHFDPTPVLLPGKSHGRSSLVGYSPWGHKELDTTEWLHFHFHSFSGGEFWQNVVHWRREWQTTSVFLPWEPHEQYAKAKRTLKDELPRSVGAQYATGGQWKNNSRKNEEMEPKQKQYPVVEATGDKVRCCKEQYCTGTWNVRFMNQGKLEAVKQEMASVSVDNFRNQRTKMDWNGWI